MKNLTKICAGLAVAAMLTGCSGLKKTTYEDFHSQAVEAAKNRTSSDYTVITSSGTYTAGGLTVDMACTVSEEKTEGSAVALTLLTSLVAMTAETVTEEDSESVTYTWYAGKSGFKADIKVEESSITYNWNKLGYVTAVKASGDYSADVKISYK